MPLSIDEDAAKPLLEKWTRWLLERGIEDDPGSDTGGDLIEQQNRDANNDPWLLPGSWNKTRMNRKIDVPVGKKLFVAAATSHATYPELPVDQAKTPANLKAHAQKIDDLWLHFGLYWGNKNGPMTRLDLTKVTTDLYKVNIHPSSNYASITTGISGEQEFVTVGHVHLYNPPRGKSYLVIAAQCPEITVGPKGEREYNMHVTYEITVP